MQGMSAKNNSIQQLRGLSRAEVAQRVAAGKINKLPPRTGKTVGNIIRSNLFTRINAILGVLFALVLTTGSWINGAFGLLIVVNSAIGIVQELRARATLESLSLIGEEHPVVIRDGQKQEIPQEQLVLDDLIYLQTGKEIVVDGEVLEAEYLAVDESMLTGEADPVLKQPGDEILSGSFVLVGTGAYRVTRVGKDSYAAKITAQAAKYELTKSRLQHSIDTILKYIVWILIPVGLLVIIMQCSSGHHDWNSLILAITGAIVPMVPEGLILITSTAFALGVIRLGKQNCLVNELPAIEGLARVNVVCADKTGTLTDNKLDCRDAYRPQYVFNSACEQDSMDIADGSVGIGLAADRDSTAQAGYSENSLADCVGNVRADCDCSSGSDWRECSESAVQNHGESAQLTAIPVDAKCREIIAQIAWSDPDPNLTMNAIRDDFSQPSADQMWLEISRKPFSSAYKWSGVTFAIPQSVQGVCSDAVASVEDNSSVNAMNFVFGAPDVLLKPVDAVYREWVQLVEQFDEQGLRALLLAKVDCAVADYEAQRAAELGFQPLAVLIFEQAIRPDVPQTLAYFRQQDVAVKVISGDNLRSVSAVSRRLGIDTSRTVDARTLGIATGAATDRDSFDRAVLESNVFGRVKPEQKQEMVHALQRGGYTVAMTGDGVNDVLALKDADIGVAMGSGSSASRSVAKIVLLDNKFSTLPSVVAEGRRVIGNIERVANLFLSKTTYSAVLAMLVIIFSVPFPFQPIHVTITGWFTIGIPAFILALPPNYRRARDGFVRRVLSFAMPAGVIVGISSFITYLLASGMQVPQYHLQESTAALATLIITSTWVLGCVARPFNPWKLLLVALPLAAYGIIFTWDFTQNLFMLDSSNHSMMITAMVIGGIGVAAIELLWRLVRRRIA